MDKASTGELYEAASKMIREPSADKPFVSADAPLAGTAARM
jgi:hypothetical protein